MVAPYKASVTYVVKVTLLPDVASVPAWALTRY